MPPFGVESSAVTFSVAAAMLIVSASLARRNSRALGLTVREPNLGLPPDQVTDQVTDQAPDGAAARFAVETTGDTSLRLRGAMAWLLAALLAVAVELWELFHSPRSAYPTLSSLANDVLGPGHRVARAAAFLCWGVCGLVVASRPGRRE
jgi:hypothetical protein